MNENEKKLKQTLSDVFAVPMDSINEDSSPDNIGNWTSLNHLNMILALEGAFNVSFTEEQTVEIINYALIRMALKEHGVKFS